MLFQLASDFHIEKYDKINIEEFITPSAPYLILAGDIGSLYKYDQLKLFLFNLSQKYKGIIYVPGNHEFYTIKGRPGLPFFKLINLLNTLQEEIPNLYILNRGVLKIEKYYIIGCILWSNCPDNEKFPSYRVKIHGFNKE